MTPRDLKRYIAAIGRRGVAPDTIRLAYAPLRLLLTTAHEDGVIPSNPAAGVRAIVSRPDAEPVEATRARALTADELARLLEHLSPRWRLLVRLLAETGLRISEALALRWDDVDLGRRRVSVRRRLYRGRIGPPKSRYGRRDVPITAALGRDLWTARKSAAAGADGDPVFATLAGGYLMAENARRAFMAAAEKAGITDASLHTLRHTCATELFRRGLNAKQAQVWLGHHSPAFTLATYVHLLSDDLPESPFELDEGDNERDNDHAEPRREVVAAEPAESRDLRAVSR
jgi:integrase